MTEKAVHVSPTWSQNPRPFKNMLSHGIGEGSCYLNAGLQFLMASDCLRNFLRNARHQDNFHLMPGQNIMDYLAITFAMAFRDLNRHTNCSDPDAIDPVIFNNLYYIRDGSAQQDACDFIREVLNKCVEVDPALANAWRFQFTPDTLHCDVPGCLYHHQVCAASNNAIEYFLDLALTSGDGKTHFTTIQQAIGGHAVVHPLPAEWW